MEYLIWKEAKKPYSYSHKSYYNTLSGFWQCRKSLRKSGIADAKLFHKSGDVAAPVQYVAQLCEYIVRTVVQKLRDRTAQQFDVIQTGWKHHGDMSTAVFPAFEHDAAPVQSGDMVYDGHAQAQAGFCI